MLALLWLLPAFPLAGFLILALAGARLPRRVVALIGAGSVGLSLLTAFAIAFAFYGRFGFELFPVQAAGAGLAAEEGVHQTLWTWMRVGTFAPGIAFFLDHLTMTMVLVITGVGFLIHLYSTRYMADDPGYSRFFAYMNLFVAAMLVLVLADNLVLLYLGWEGVGLCSFLLIGFWYTKQENAYAAMKAFVVTRIGDTALAIGLFLLFTALGTLQIQAMDFTRLSPGLALAAALLLLGGAVGKSAQLPLQTWLPDAMAGPSPVSALIHAATMVTAGVYLIARMHNLFELAPAALNLVGIVGAVTLFIAACSATVQCDLKRTLAYSTISQLGYMFLALGVGAFSAAIFHLVTHAFFKALLFLAAGVVIHSVHEEQNMFKMGGLRQRLPVIFWTFLIGAASLAALPFITAGFYSKDEILHAELVFPGGTTHYWLWGIAMVGAFITAYYAFRMVFLVFYGKEKTKPSVHREPLIAIPLVVLAVLALVGGFIEWPPVVFEPLLHGTLIERAAFIASVLLPLLGIWLASQLYLRRPMPAEAPRLSPAGRFLLAGWGFDWLYDRLFVRPFVWLARTFRFDIIDYLYTGIAALTTALHRLFSYLQTGHLRWYALAIAFGAAVILGMVMFARGGG